MIFKNNGMAIENEKNIYASERQNQWSTLNSTKLSSPIEAKPACDWNNLTHPFTVPVARDLTRHKRLDDKWHNVVLNKKLTKHNKLNT